MSYATRNENGDNMGNTFVRCPVQDKKKFAENWDRIFGKSLDEVDKAVGVDLSATIDAKIIELRSFPEMA